MAEEEFQKLASDSDTIEANTVNGASRQANFSCQWRRGSRKECASGGAPAQSSAAPRSEPQQVHFIAASTSSNSQHKQHQQTPVEKYSRSSSCQAVGCRCKCVALAAVAGNKIDGPLIEWARMQQRLKVSECRARECYSKMRPIVTPVSYGQDYIHFQEKQPTASMDNGSHEDADTDSLDGSQAESASTMSRQQLERKLCSPRWAPPTDGRQLEQRVLRRLFGGHGNSRCHHHHQPATSRFAATGTSASGSPNSIVKHRRSSSRTLLNQLARLRRLQEPKYCVRRPEKVAEVERLIDELERAAIGWDEDEHLLDRAERRDKPPISSPKSVPAQASSTFYEPLGERTDVPSLEQQAIESCQTHHPRQPTARERTQDDLAIRRLTSQSLKPAGSSITGASCPQPSYLLCMNSYVMPNSISNKLGCNVQTPFQESDDDDDERYLRQHDLHLRRLRSRPEAHEPPFGIPRQPAVHSSASHYLRRPQSSATMRNPAQVNQVQKRTDSRVSFASSVDSGLAAASPISRHTPVSPGGAQPNQQQQQHHNHDYHNDDLATEIQLEELSRQSPGVEVYRTEFTSTPKRARPRIRIEKPRSKSPLLTTSHPGNSQQSIQEKVEEETSTSTVKVMSYREARRLEEVECKYDFDDEEEDEDGEEDASLDERRKSHAAAVRAQRVAKHWKQPPTTGNQQHSTTSNEDRNSSEEDSKMAPSRNKDAPLFRIGQYKHCESRARLTIL